MKDARTYYHNNLIEDGKTGVIANFLTNANKEHIELMTKYAKYYHTEQLKLCEVELCDCHEPYSQLMTDGRLYCMTCKRPNFILVWLERLKIK